MEFGTLFQFGMPGLLVLIAWQFWDKTRRIANLSLIAGVFFACMAAYGEACPARHEVRLDPPATPAWSGFYDTGQPVEKVEAILLRNGAEVPDSQDVRMRSTTTIDDRALQVADRRNEEQLVVNFGDYPQGIISYDDLTEQGWRLVSDTAVLLSVALTDRITTKGDCASVPVDSTAQPKFESWKLCLDGWVYAPVEGVDVTVYKDDVRVVSPRLDRQSEIDATYQGEQVFVKIMHLGFVGNDTPTDFVSFLVFKKS